MDLHTKLHNLREWIANPRHSKTPCVVSSKIEVRDFPGSGRGLYAKLAISASENLVRISPSLLLNFSTIVAHVSSYNSLIGSSGLKYDVYIPPPVLDDVGEIYSHFTLEQLLGLLSFQIVPMYLVLEKRRNNSWWKPFIAMLPDLSELAMTPIVWKENHGDLWHLLPRLTRKHAEKVIARFDKDYEVVNNLVPMDRQDFLWAWMCVNSRCLYMEIAQGKDAADNFTMCPYVDFLNHSSSDQCGIKIDSLGFHVTTSTSYSPGDELFFSYGPHLNEFLFCEYGFLLSENKWNYLDISDFILPLLSPKQAQFLQLRSYFGDYTVNAEDVSFRTEVALAVIQEQDPENSRRLGFYVDGMSAGEVYQQKSKLLLRRILAKMAADSRLRLELLENGDATQRAVAQLHRDIVGLAERHMDN